MTPPCQWKPVDIPTRKVTQMAIMATIDMQSVVRRDRRIVLFCLLLITSLAWLYLGLSAHSMDDAMAWPHVMVWTSIDFLLMFVMWVVMMLGMMLPSASPMILTFARINRDQAGTTGSPKTLVPAWVFAAGYIAIWSAFSLGATVLQWALQQVGMLSPMMASTSAVFSSVVLIAAGVYQWTPLKHACLRHCQTPLGFFLNHWRDGVMGAFQMGLAHGAYCVGCCWALMLLLFVGGVMNLVWVAVLALIVFVEKVIPPGRWPPRIVGMFLIAWGGSVLADAILRWPKTVAEVPI